MSAISTSQIISFIISSNLLICKFEQCYVVIKTTMHRSVTEQTRNNGIHINWPTSYEWRVSECNLNTNIKNKNNIVFFIFTIRHYISSRLFLTRIRKSCRLDLAHQNQSISNNFDINLRMFVW